MTPIHTMLSTILLTDTAGSPVNLLARPEVMMGAMIVMFYFLLIRPQQRQKKEMAARIASIQTGDKVITTSGIHGLIHHVKEHTLMIKVAEGIMLEFDKAAVAVVHKKDTASAK